MLYLNVFLNVMIKNSFKSLCFLVTGFALGFTLTQSDKLQEKMMSQLPKLGGEPHFFALIDKKINSESIRRKLMDLPGVKAVRNVNQSSMTSKLKTILGDVGVDIPEEMITGVSGIKVSFDPELEARSQKLIKKYIGRMAGEDNVTLGPTIEANKKSREWLGSFKSSIRMKIGTVLVVLISLLYLIFGISLGGELGTEAYLIERFSRRKNVVQVAAALGFFSLAALMVLPGVLLGSMNFIGLGIFLVLTFCAYFVTIKRGWRTT